MWNYGRFFHRLCTLTKVNEIKFKVLVHIKALALFAPRIEQSCSEKGFDHYCTLLKPWHFGRCAFMHDTMYFINKSTHHITKNVYDITL